MSAAAAGHKEWLKRDIIVRPEDENLHKPDTDNKLWSESFYLDCVSDDGKVAVWTRIGRLVNKNETFYAAYIVEEGKPSIRILDEHAPLTEEVKPDWHHFKTKDLDVTYALEENLKKFRVKSSGYAEAYEEPATVLKGKNGRPIQASYDLLWETDGVPFSWTRTTRYEIPCRVTGTIEIDGRKINFSGPGQRDHSWAVRDWHAHSWVWTAFHLSDGSHLHGCEIPGAPGIGEGYIDNKGDKITVLELLESEHEFGPDGHVGVGKLKLQPGNLVAKLTPIAFGSLLMTHEDGRKVDFVRCSARLEFEDGRTGLGWIEYNWVKK